MRTASGPVVIQEPLLPLRPVHGRYYSPSPKSPPPVQFCRSRPGEVGQFPGMDFLMLVLPHSGVLHYSNRHRLDLSPFPSY